MELKFDCRHQFDSRPGNGNETFHLNSAFETSGMKTVLFGASGAGKSTILSMIAGVMIPNEGSIWLGDRCLFDHSKKLFVRPEARSIGYVMQDALLFPHMTVEKNLEFGKRCRKEKSGDIDMNRIVEVLELGGLLERYSTNLSGGERQRVAIGRALASGPALLLMDEPVAHLDQDLRKSVLKYLQQSTSEMSVPLIYVTHSTDEANMISDNWIRIERGKMVEDQPA